MIPETINDRLKGQLADAVSNSKSKLSPNRANGSVEGHVKNNGEIAELSATKGYALGSSPLSVNDAVISNLELLLGSVLTSIDASIPNKDQNKATKHIIRKQFDEVYFRILKLYHPGCEFGIAPGYAVQPKLH